MSGLLLNGPTLNSLLGMVRLNGVPLWDVNSNVISAGKEATSEQGMPYVSGSSEKG
jgi:hypothetical protein